MAQVFIPEKGDYPAQRAGIRVIRFGMWGVYGLKFRVFQTSFKGGTKGVEHKDSMKIMDAATTDNRCKCQHGKAHGGSALHCNDFPPLNPKP